MPRPQSPLSDDISDEDDADDEQENSPPQKDAHQPEGRRLKRIQTERNYGWKTLKEQAAIRSKIKAISHIQRAHTSAKQRGAHATHVQHKTVEEQVAEWQEIPTDCSDTEQIDRLATDLKNMGGGGTFDPDLCEEYNNLERIITRFLKVDPPTSAIFALCQLQELDMADPINQLAFLEIGGLRPLLEIIKETQPKINIGAVQILSEIAVHAKIQYNLVRLKGVNVIVKLMRSANQQLQTLAAEMFDKLSASQPICNVIRHAGGIDAIMYALHMKADPPETFLQPAVSALHRLSAVPKNRSIIHRRQGVRLLEKLLQSADVGVLVSSASMMVECIEDAGFRSQLHGSPIIKMLLQHIHSQDAVLNAKCGEAVCKCAEQGIDTELINRSNVMGPLLSLLETSDPKLLGSATAAIQQSLVSENNVIILDKLGGVHTLVEKMTEHGATEEVQIKITAAMCNVAKLPAGRVSLNVNGAIEPLVKMLKLANRDLLINVTAALAACAVDDDNKKAIAQHDGLRLLWSLLSSSSHKLQANAAAAICPCLDNANNLAIVGESFVGGLQVLVNLLTGNDEDVQANVCASIANLAKFNYTLSVITEQGVLEKLVALTSTRNDNLRRHLMRAVIRCCRLEQNSIRFGELDGVRPLVLFLRSNDSEVLRYTVIGMLVLSEQAGNCEDLMNAKVLPLLTDMLKSTDHVMQELAAAVMNNIRKFRSSFRQ